MVSTQSLLEEIDRVFPLVEKPSGKSLSFHETDCLECEFVRNDLAEHCGPELPDEAIRYLHDEMSCLSAQGWRWVLPSYLRRCLNQDPYYDPVETEFLIYNLAPKPEFEAETRQRLGSLSENQIGCLQQFIEWCKNHPHWSEYCSDEISIATAFLSSLKNAANPT